MADKVTATPEALDLIAEIVDDHGPVMFHQSGGCCDGSSPMCYPKGEFLIGGERNMLEGQYAGGYYIKPTVFKGHNKMRVFQEEIFGPVVSVTTFKTDEEALSIANDTLYGLGAGVWSRDANRCYRFGRAIQAGRVWTNCYHAYPAHAAFGGYKQSGVGRENHKMMLDHYQQTKNMLVSYSPKKLGFF